MITYTYSGNVLNIQLSELSHVDIEIETDVFLEPSKMRVVIGNTFLVLDEPIYQQQKNYYKLNLNHLNGLLPGSNNEAHLSEQRYATKSGARRFARIFVNEIGLSKIYVHIEGAEVHVANVIVETNKISSENYELVTLYLISVGYFDSNILYKAVLEGSQNDIKNTLLEALRELLKKLNKWKESLPAFKFDPIRKYSYKQNVVSYDKTQPVDEDSIDWLIDNPSVFKKVDGNSSDLDAIINNHPVRIESILLNEISKSTDTYENAIILGFLINLRRLLLDLGEEIFSRTPRTRISNFKEFLISCFNNLILQTVVESGEIVKTIYAFHTKELPVTSPVFGFPSKIEGFFRKMHYREVLQLIDYSRHLFNLDLNINNFNLEVESFDRLFEIYCFYLLKDTISNNVNDNNWQEVLLGDKNNKLAGTYTIKSGDIFYTIFYEDFPPEFTHFTRFSYKPDFIIRASNSKGAVYCILDAKYKNYDPIKLQLDLAKLTLNYLHKIGVSDTSKQQVIGLFTISLMHSASATSGLESIFKHDYSFNGEKPVLPQIGSIVLTPKKIDVKSNQFLSIYHFMIKVLNT
ncbi:hypothetical protein [Chitinophaga sp. Cy-1792]|uniref:hypothetical protein n=1 Tax=Chitinophaga sp. Cy-1792 TaxID=2608339 RepID=UPI001421A16F|nr:hypothetical protein [Chitinophaga sp. Cy-1792]NIG54524.1 hypothetical protein [Chitinophaga sp. Cy-1792]